MKNWWRNFDLFLFKRNFWFLTIRKEEWGKILKMILFLGILTSLITAAITSTMKAGRSVAMWNTLTEIMVQHRSFMGEKRERGSSIRHELIATYRWIRSKGALVVCQVTKGPKRFGWMTLWHVTRRSCRSHIRGRRTTTRNSLSWGASILRFLTTAGSGGRRETPGDKSLMFLTPLSRLTIPHMLMTMTYSTIHSTRVDINDRGTATITRWDLHLSFTSSLYILNWEQWMIS